MYTGYGIAFDEKGSWSFGNYEARNVVILSADISSSFYTYNQKNNFLILAEGGTFGINGKFSASEKTFNINFSIVKAELWLILHHNGDNSNLFVNGKEIYKFKASNKNVDFPTNFCLGIISNKFS